MPCTLIPATQCDGSLLATAQARTLQAAGISTKLWAEFEHIGYVITAIANVSLAVLIRLRRPEDWFAVFLLLAFVAFNTDSTTLALAKAHPVWSLPFQWLSALGTAAFPIVFYLFPDGHCVPRWTRYLLAAWLLGLISVQLSNTPTENHNILRGAWLAITTRAAGRL